MEIGLFEVGDIVARLEPGRHPHELAFADEIEAQWRQKRARNPTLFNGRTILGTGWAVEDGVLRLTCREIGYKTLLHWLDRYGRAHERRARDARPPDNHIHFFANPVMVGSDGNVVVARMAELTYNAGQVYMPSGSFEPVDFADGTADLSGNMRREVLEETGIDLAEAREAPSYQVYFGGNFLALFRVYRFGAPTRVLMERAGAYLADGGDGELTELFSLAPGEAHADMPFHASVFMKAFSG